METQELEDAMKNLVHAVRALAEQLQLHRNELAEHVQSLKQPDPEDKRAKHK